MWLELLFKVGYRKELQEELRKEVKGRLGSGGEGGNRKKRKAQ